jgi:hypothetical protein
MATISLLQEPYTLEPINSDLWYKVNSASSSVTNFKYVFRPQYRLEPFVGAYTTLSIYKVPPRPVTGDGLFSPSRVLKSFIQNKINPYTIAFVSGFNSSLPGVPYSYIDYNVRYGFEYSPNAAWYNTSNLSGKVGLTFSAAHEFAVGDILILDKDNKTINQSYDGTCSVTQVVNAFQIKTDINYGVAPTTGTEPGVVTTLQRLTATSSTGRYTWNGTRQYLEGDKNFTNQFILASASTDFLTDWPASTYKAVQVDDYETVSMILQGATNSVLYVDTYNSGMTLLNTYGFTISNSNNYRRVDFGIGPKNLSNAGVSLTDVDNYRFYTKYNGLTSSVFRYYKIDNQCSNYEKVRITFLNRAGGWDYFNFTLDSKRSVSVSRTEYEKVLAYNYSVGDRGKTLLAQKAEPKMTITSNWITEKESSWLEELITSPEVYVLGNTSNLGAASGGYKLPIVVTDNSYEVKTYLRNQVFNLQLNFKYAYDLNLQNE